MALKHAHPAQAVDMRPLGNTALTQTKSAALFKSEQLEVVRIVNLVVIGYDRAAKSDDKQRQNTG